TIEGRALRAVLVVVLERLQIALDLVRGALHLGARTCASRFALGALGGVAQQLVAPSREPRLLRRERAHLALRLGHRLIAGDEMRLAEARAAVLDVLRELLDLIRQRLQLAFGVVEVAVLDRGLQLVERALGVALRQCFAVDELARYTVA